MNIADLPKTKLGDKYFKIEDTYFNVKIDTYYVVQLSVNHKDEVSVFLRKDINEDSPKTVKDSSFYLTKIEAEAAKKTLLQERVAEIALQEADIAAKKKALSDQIV